MNYIIKNKFICVLGLLFMLYGGILFIFSGFNAGNIMVLGLGAVFIFLSIECKIFRNNTVFILFRFAIYLGLGFLAAMISFILIFSNTEKTSFNEDAVIVLGSGLHGEKVSRALEERLIACLEYLEKNKNALVVVSGGQGSNEDITEALAMERYLVENGVDPSKIIKEENSTSTYENFVFSKKILDKYFNGNYTTAYITNKFHSYRAFNLAINAGIPSKSFNASDEVASALPAYLRETLAVVKLWIFKV